MKKDEFLEKRYFGKDDNGKEQAWRQITLDWLEPILGLALALNDFTSNTSLALAFEFIDSGEVLLLAGDAQIGSWLTWDKLLWKVTDPNGSKREVRLKDLFPWVVY